MNNYVRKLFGSRATNDTTDTAETGVHSHNINIANESQNRQKDPLGGYKGVFTDGSWENSDSSDDDNEKPKKQKRDNMTRNRELGDRTGRGKMRSGVVKFDGVYNKFDVMDTPDFRDNFEPPHVPDLEDEELSQLLTWTKQRIKNKDELLNDKMYDFLVLVSGASNTPMSRSLPGTTNTRQGTVPGFGGMGGTQLTTAGPTGIATRTGISPSVQGGLLYSPPYNPGLTSPTRSNRIARGEVVQPLPLASPTEQRAIRLAMEREQEQKSENNTRLLTGYSWIEKPEVIGLMTVAPPIYFAANSAFAMIKNITNLKTFHVLEDFHPFIYSNLQEVRVLFATLTRLQMATTDVLFPTRTNLENTNNRINQQTYCALQRLMNYKWNPEEHEFSKKGTNSIVKPSSVDLWNPFSVQLLKK